MSRLDPPSYTMEELIQAVSHYRPSSLLRASYFTALDLSKADGNRLWLERTSGGVTEKFVVTPFGLALLNRLSLVGASELAAQDVNGSAWAQLLFMVANLDQPFDDWRTLLVRAGFEQSWYQEDIRRAIGRSFLLFHLIPEGLDRPEFDIPSEFANLSGLTVEAFLQSGFLLFTAAITRYPFFYPTTVLARVEVEPIRQVWTPETVHRLLALMARKQADFRVRAAEVGADGGVGRYDFNPLFEAPLIQLSGGQVIAPIPDLVIWRLFDAPFHELRNKFQGEGKANEFTSFFGKEVFERYVGMQLESGMPGTTIIGEMPYVPPGGTEKRSPDWIVVSGSVGLAVECTIGGPTVATRSTGDVDALEQDLQRKYLKKVNDMPTKIRELTAAHPELGLSGVETWHRLVVCKDPIPFSAMLTGEFLEPLVEPDSLPFHLMSVSEFEDLMSLGDASRVLQVLAAKEASSDTLRQDFRVFVVDEANRRGIPLRNRLVADAQDAFFDRLGLRKFQPA